MHRISSKPSDSIDLFRLENRNGMSVEISNLGGIIQKIIVPDRNGNFADVALGFPNVEQSRELDGHPYFGCIVGRFANRIASGQFSIGEKVHQLVINNGPNHLHGGTVGFDQVIWNSQTRESDDTCCLELNHLSPDGHEGYPGNLDVKVSYTLDDRNHLTVQYHASTDQPTHINLTQHTYFNLKGEGRGDVLDHTLQINAGKFTPIDENSIPTGQIANVQDTPFDFRFPKKIGQDIVTDHLQLKIGHGYDHNFVIDGEPGLLRETAVVREDTSGRTLTVCTDQPGVQLYTGNFLDGRFSGKSGTAYNKHSGFCLETQHFPDSPNRSSFPTTLLMPEETFASTTIYKFSTA